MTTEDLHPSIKSPVTGRSGVKYLYSIDIQNLIGKYQKLLQIDVCENFDGVEKVSVLKCMDTGYFFYYPFNIAGDGKFYEKFQKFDWYYMPWKWEHKQALKLIKPSMRVLEVGSGQGGFLKEVKNSVAGVELKGLELNLDAVKSSRSEGLDVYPELVQSFVKHYKDYFDIVCSFQVLEHISDVNSFLNAKIDLLKKGGSLIIAVPNNNSFCKFDRENDILNMPPHHMGCWTPYSLSQIPKYFPLKLLALKKEPLQEYHLNWYISVWEKRIMMNNGILYRILRRIKIFSMIKRIIRHFPSLINGHTVLVIFKKL